MTTDEVVRKALLDEHADTIREAVQIVGRQLMEVEVSELIGAELGEETDQGFCRVRSRIASALRAQVRI